MIKIFMASLGCAKNLVDAETMLGETLDEEFSLELDPAAADVIIINTCGFIEEARNEARSVIGEYLAVKKKVGRGQKVVAAGCWAERDPEGLVREFPGLDAIWGLSAPSSLRENIRALERGGGISGIGKRPSPREGARLLATPSSFAYLRLSDGCDNRCHYCAIPGIRGGLSSRRPEAIIEEAKILAGQGVKELVLIGQDTTAYGQDRHRPGSNLASLLETLLAAVPVPRIRLLYAHPAHLDDQTMDLLLSEPRLCRYLDLPIQHVSDPVLERMGRNYRLERILAILQRLGGAVTLRTTLLLGHPGEKEADFLQALEFVSQGHFQHLGAFAYSPEPGTAAYGQEDRAPAEEAERRRDAVLAAQSAVAFAWLDSRVGGAESILVDSVPEPGWGRGRNVSEAPDADGVVWLRGGDSAPGDILEACIVGREGYDLVAAADERGKRPRPRKKQRKR